LWGVGGGGGGGGADAGQKKEAEGDHWVFTWDRVLKGGRLRRLGISHTRKKKAPTEKKTTRALLSGLYRETVQGQKGFRHVRPGLRKRGPKRVRGGTGGSKRGRRGRGFYFSRNLKACGEGAKKKAGRSGTNVEEGGGGKRCGHNGVFKREGRKNGWEEAQPKRKSRGPHFHFSGERCGGTPHQKSELLVTVSI